MYARGKSCVEGPVAYDYEYSDYQNCVTKIEKLDFEVILYCEISRPVYKLWFLLKYIYMYIVSNFFVQIRAQSEINAWMFTMTYAYSIKLSSTNSFHSLKVICTSFYNSMPKH